MTVRERLIRWPQASDLAIWMIKMPLTKLGYMGKSMYLGLGQGTITTANGKSSTNTFWILFYTDLSLN